jgi:hypothetical protein
MRPHVLLVPTLTAIEWRITPEVGEWAEVASYDVPGVGDEPRPERFDLDSLVDRGAAELDRLGWERFVVVGDEHSVFPAVGIAAARADGLAGVALGHASLSYERKGDRAPIRGELMSAMNQLAERDYRSFARALTQLTQEGIDEATADEYIQRVPQEITLGYLPQVMRLASEVEVEKTLRELDPPLLFAKHEDCLAWTDEGFEDAVAAFPEAVTMTTKEKPSASPLFVAALREFCAGLDWS